MHEANQGAAEEGTPPLPSGGDLAAPFTAGPPPAPDPIAALHGLEGPSVLRGLRIWFFLIAAMGLLGLLFDQGELALSMTVAGAFVAAHAVDRDPYYKPLYLLLTGVLVVGAALLFAVLAFWLAAELPAGPLRPVAVGIAGGGAVLCVLTTMQPLSDGLASAVFRTLAPTHVVRLAARLVMMMLLLVIPGAAAVPGLIEVLADRPEPLLGNRQLIGTMVGYSLLALAGVGFLVRRDARATRDRLGLRALRPAHLALVAVGVAALFLLNLGAEEIQRRWFPELWEQDQRIVQLMARGLGVAGALLLGLCAGVGEELAIRGALQPRLGLVFTALVFALLHVQYSWFGIVTVFALGIGLGVIRNRANTTAAILVHMLYDVLVVLAIVR